MFIKYFTFFSKTAILKYSHVQHLLEEPTEESDVSDVNINENDIK